MQNESCESMELIFKTLALLLWLCIDWLPVDVEQQPAEAVSLLAEMFPTVSTSELVRCLSLAEGSVNVAAQQVLERMDLADEHCSSPTELPASSVFSYYHKKLSLWGRDVRKWFSAFPIHPISLGHSHFQDLCIDTSGHENGREWEWVYGNTMGMRIGLTMHKFQEWESWWEWEGLGILKTITWSLIWSNRTFTLWK